MAYVGQKPATTLTMPTSQYFNGDGSTTAFTLNKGVTVSEELEVFVDNVQQEPGTGKSYTATGTTLTFDAAPSSGTGNVYVVYRGLSQFNARLEHDPNAALAATTGTFSGDLTVDTNTLYADSTNNRVGIGNSSPTQALDVSGKILGGGTAAQYDSGLVARASSHSTSRRASIDFGSWVVGQDAPANGTKDFFFYDGVAGAHRMNIDTSGRVTMPNQPFFLARPNASYYPSSGSGHLFSATNVITNRGSIYNSTNSRFTAPVAGIYSINYGISWYPANNGSYLGSYFTVSSGGSYYFFNNPGSDINNLVSADVYLAANDYVTFYTYSSNTSNGVSTSSYITGCLVA